MLSNQWLYSGQQCWHFLCYWILAEPQWRWSEVCWSCTTRLKDFLISPFLPQRHHCLRCAWLTDHHHQFSFLALFFWASSCVHRPMPAMLATLLSVSSTSKQEEPAYLSLFSSKNSLTSLNTARPWKASLEISTFMLMSQPILLLPICLHCWMTLALTRRWLFPPTTQVTHLTSFSTNVMTAFSPLILTTHWTSQTTTSSCLRSVSPSSCTILCTLRPGHSLLLTSPSLKLMLTPNSSIPHNSPPASSTTFSKSYWTSMPLPSITKSTTILLLLGSLPLEPSFLKWSMNNRAERP